MRLEPEKALVVLVGEDGQVENRVLTLPAGVPSSALTEATNFLNARIRGRTLAEARLELETALTESRTELDQLTQKVISAGIASWSGGTSDDRGLGMTAAEQGRMNALLAGASHADAAELLQTGRVGLAVVATLARRHGVTVRLRAGTSPVPTLAELRAHVAGQLEGAASPRSVVVLPDLPYLASGKPDVAAVRDLLAGTERQS